MRIAVLGSAESWYLRDLRRAAGSRDEILAVPFGRIAHAFSPGESRYNASGFSFAEADAVLVRTMPPGRLEQIVFRMDCLAGLESEGQLVVNPAKAIEVAVDKYLALLRLKRAGILIPATVACQTAEEVESAFAFLRGDVVVKPLFGS